MKKIFAAFIFALIFTGLYGEDYLSLKGGIATPVDREEQKYFKDVPCVELGYTHIFENNISCGCDIGFFYQKRDEKNRMLNNYMIDFTVNAGYDFSFNNFDIIPKALIGYGNYTFEGFREKINFDFLSYGAKIECSYTFSKYYNIIFEPQFVCYDKDPIFKPVKILLGVGAYF